MKLETAPELDLDEAVFLGSTSFSLNIKQNSLKCKQKGVQNHNKYTLEDNKYCLENNMVLTFLLEVIKTDLKKNEGFVFKNLLDKRKKIKPKFQLNDLVRAADLKKTFLKGDTTNSSYKLYKITEIINDTIPSYKIENLKERYNESLLKKTELTLKENNIVKKKLNLS